MKPAAQACWLLAAASLATGVAATAAPITFNTALPVSKDEIIWREQLVFDRSHTDNGKRTELTLLSVVGYGASRRWSLFGVLPLTRRRLDERAERQTSGLGDARLLARYTAFQRDRLAETLRVAPYVGVKLPSGRNEIRDGLGVLPPAVQPGLGSWDLFGGVVATYATLDWVVDAEIDYEIRTEADGLGRGDHFSAHTSVQYRLLPAQPWRATAGFLFAVLEAKFQREARDGIGGAAAARTGGTRVFVAPGLQYATKRWIAEVAVEIPVAQDLRADAFESDVIMRSGFRINF